MSVKNLDLGHSSDNAQTIVRFLCQGIAKQIQLLEEGKFRKELEESFQVTKLVVRRQQQLDKFVFSNARNAVQAIILSVDLLHTEVWCYFVKVL